MYELSIAIVYRVRTVKTYLPLASVGGNSLELALFVGEVREAVGVYDAVVVPLNDVDRELKLENS